MNTEMLNALKEKAHTWAVGHGFYEEVKPDAFYLGLVMSEAGEAINADRRGRHADTKRFEEIEAAEKDFPFAENFKAHIKDSVEDEIADIVIRLLDFAGLRRFELEVTHSTDINFLFQTLFDKIGLPAHLFCLIGLLYHNRSKQELEPCVSAVISMFSDNFKNMTGSDKDLWWFVEKKMRYNELRPKLNGKKY